MIAYEARGKVTAADYETILIPAVEQALKEHDKVRLLYHLGDAFSGFEAEALWDDAKVGLRHLTSWERIAVVTDVAWIRSAATAWGATMPGQVRIFTNAELSAAKEVGFRIIDSDVFRTGPGSRRESEGLERCTQAFTVSSNNSRAAFVKAHMFASRFDWPVSTVVAFSTGPTTAMQLCPAASP